MKQVSFTCLLSFLLLAAISPSFARPNILLIESDDQSNLAVGAFGFGKMHTPAIDTLAETGVYFTRAYNMGCWSPAVCVPSRTMLFNGTFLWEAQKVTPKNVPGPSLTEHLKNQGYSTWFTGKWHAQGKGPKETFDHVGRILPGQLKTFWTPEGHITDIVGKEAVSFVEKAAEKEDPFFIYVAFNAPHVPRETEQKYYDLYPVSDMEIPPSVKDGPLHPYINYNYSANPLSSEAMKKRYQQNNAMVTHMDERIGDILAALRESGEYENTIIVFLSDQGINFGENGVAGKVCLYDVSVQAPLIIAGPSIQGNRKIQERVYLQDIYPTLLELAGIDIPKYIDFKSLNPLINGETEKSPHESIYMAMFDNQRGMIYDNHKLILYPQVEAAELYDLSDDPWEMNDLMGEEGSAKVLKQMGLQFAEWQKVTGDTLDLDVIYPSLF